MSEEDQIRFDRGSYKVGGADHTTWRKSITAEMRRYGETWADVVHCTLDDAQLDEEFESDFGGREGEPFTLWTHSRVYFPASYDGAEWVASAPRNPSDEAMEHVGN